MNDQNKIKLNKNIYTFYSEVAKLRLDFLKSITPIPIGLAILGVLLSGSDSPGEPKGLAKINKFIIDLLNLGSNVTFNYVIYYIFIYLAVLYLVCLITSYYEYKFYLLYKSELELKIT